MLKILLRKSFISSFVKGWVKYSDDITMVWS